MKFHYSFLVLLLFVFANAICQTTTYVSINPEGKLSYLPDEKGNVIPDFSGVGYRNGEVQLPDVAVVKEISPVAGDNYVHLQTAIDQMATLPLDEKGFRGALLLKAGQYPVSKMLGITASGIVLRGEGQATELRATGTTQYDLVRIRGYSGKSDIASTQKKITDQYVAIGAKKVTVEAGHEFKVGDKVHIRREPNDSWIKLLGMDKLSLLDPAATNWTASGYKINFERQILKVEGNVLTLDAPIVDPIDPQYASGYVTRFNSSRIFNCGIENLKMTSTYTSTWHSSVSGVAHDEKHGWNAIYIDNAEHCWVRNVIAFDFGYSCVNIQTGAAFVTVDNCAHYDPISKLEGGRRYSFNVDGHRNLVKNCITRNGRHDYVNGSRTPGPNVFYNCTATNQKADMGPHHRWSTGILLDNISGDGQLRVQDRADSGSGHGWSGSQIMFWNCTVNNIVIQDPPWYHTNWAIGCIAPTITNVGQWTTHPMGIVQSPNKKITAIPSLYMAQLNQRLNDLKTDLPGQPTSALKMEVYPNPARQTLNVIVELKSPEEISLSLADVSGKVIRHLCSNEIASNTTSMTFDVSDIKQGLYFVQLRFNGVTETKKILLEN